MKIHVNKKMGVSKLITLETIYEVLLHKCIFVTCMP
jgi:hypothetical protein